MVTREHRVTCHSTSDYIYMMLEWSSCCFTSSSSSFLACNSRLCSTIRRHHPPQRAVLSQICCFGEHKVVLFQILLDGAEHMMRGRPSCLLQSAGGEANRILLASALSSMCIICPNRVSRRDWIIAVSLGCFVSLRTSSFCTNWYHLMPSSIRRHHWSSASILRASVLDIAQQSKPYRFGLVRYTCCTASTSLRWRAVTSKYDFLSSAWQHE